MHPAVAGGLLAAGMLEEKTAQVVLRDCFCLLGEAQQRHWSTDFKHIEQKVFHQQRKGGHTNQSQTCSAPSSTPHTLFTLSEPYTRLQETAFPKLASIEGHRKDTSLSPALVCQLHLGPGIHFTPSSL